MSASREELILELGRCFVRAAVRELLADLDEPAKAERENQGTEEGEK